MTNQNPIHREHITDYWISCRKFTVRVRAKDGRITRDGTAPIVTRFVGQPLNRLLDWAGKFGDLRVAMLPEVGGETTVSERK